MPRAQQSKRTPLKRFTPTGVRRFFFKLELLGKRRSELMYDYSNLDPVVDTPPAKAPPRYHFQSSHGKENILPPRAPIPVPLTSNIRQSSRPHEERVALINEDLDEDAVVITTLDAVPFCCHEDLITMSRDQLIKVALTLNARLPSVMSIDTDRVLATSWIRASIERVVGLRPDVPQAPKVLRILTDSESEKRLLSGFDMHAQMDKTPPTSPLASRSRSYGQLGSLLSPGLDRLVEDDEEDQIDFDGIDVDEADRQSKKRKIVVEETEGDSDSDVDMASEQTPTPLPLVHRVRSQYLNASTSPTPVRVLRSQSQTVVRAPAIDASFMSDRRLPISRYQTKPKERRVILEKVNLEPIGAPRRSGRLRPKARPEPLVSSNRSNTLVPAATTEWSVNSVRVVGSKRKRSVGSLEAARQGLNRMTMECGVNSDDVEMDTNA